MERGFGRRIEEGVADVERNEIDAALPSRVDARLQLGEDSRSDGADGA